MVEGGRSVGGEYLEEKYGNSPGFRSSVEKRSEPSDNLPEKIDDYLKRVFRAAEKKSSLFKKEVLYPRLIIKEEDISEKYFKNILLGNLAERMGYNPAELADPSTREIVMKRFKETTGVDFDHYSIDQKEKLALTEQVIGDQQDSLDCWFDYLTSEEAQNYPQAFRYWAFVEAVKLGSYDPLHKRFNKRDKDTAAPFPELNPQALSLVLDEVIKYIQRQPTELDLPAQQHEELAKLLESRNFSRLYAWALEYVRSLKTSEDRLSIIEGEWRCYKKGSDAASLCQSLEGHATHWCIAGRATAESYLSRSDVWVYYSQDENGDNTIPRAAIVSNDSDVLEVRGILNSQEARQHLDSYITPVVEKKLSQLPGGERWLQMTKDNRRIAQIHRKYLRQEELTNEDLAFIYEIYRPIKSSGYQRDPRITEILKNRNASTDIVSVLNSLPSDFEGGLNLSFLRSAEELRLPRSVGGGLNLGGFKSAERLRLPQSIGGDLDLSRLTSAEGLTLPQNVGGSLNLRNLTTAEGLRLPQSIGGDLYLGGLTSVEGLTFPQTVGGSLNLEHLRSAEGLTLPQSVGGDLILRSLKSAEGLTLPQSIGGSLNLGGLTSAEGLRLPQSIGGSLNLGDLTSAEGLRLPQSIGGSLNLWSLTSAEGLTLPQSIGGYLNLENLTSAEGLTLPQSVGGDLDLRSLTSAEGLTLPQSVGGYLNLRNLTSAEGLTLPQSIGGSLNLGGLTSAEGLTLPQSIGRSLDLGGLTSAEGLTLPQSVGGDLILWRLTSAEGLTLPQSVGGYLNLENLTSAEGLTFPQSVGGNLNLENLTSAEGLTLPQSIGGSLYLGGLTSAEGLTLPQSIGGSLYLGGLTSAEGLTLPQSIGGSLYLGGLTSAEGLTLPQSIGGSLDLGGLTSAEGLTLPQSVGVAVYLRVMPRSDREELARRYPNLSIHYYII